MPVTWEIRGSRLRLALSGKHTLDELEKAAGEVLGSPMFRPGMSVLVDVRLATVNPSAEEIRDRVARLAPYLARVSPSRECAIVTGSDPHRYGINKSIASFGSRAGFDVRVFHELDEALGWLADAESA
jgi:stage II sporulation SpoAA-like protein